MLGAGAGSRTPSTVRARPPPLQQLTSTSVVTTTKRHPISNPTQPAQQLRLQPARLPETSHINSALGKFLLSVASQLQYSRVELLTPLTSTTPFWDPTLFPTQFSLFNTQRTIHPDIQTNEFLEITGRRPYACLGRPCQPAYALPPPLAIARQANRPRSPPCSLTGSPTGQRRAGGRLTKPHNRCLRRRCLTNRRERASTARMAPCSRPTASEPPETSLPRSCRLPRAAAA